MRPQLYDQAPTDLRRRRSASLRFEPLECGRRDPLDPPCRNLPNTYGLTREELAAEVARCARAGWARWELGRRFGRRRAAA